MRVTIPLAFGWRHLLFANWPVDAGTVQAHLPEGLSVQTHDGDAWLSIVPFENVNMRPRGVPRMAGIDVPELNLRTYATCDGEPGVYFFSLDAESISGVFGARFTHHLPYYYARIDFEPTDGTVEMSSSRLHPGSRPARFDATYGPRDDAEAFEAEPGSLAEFLTERRRLYTPATDGSMRYTDIEHERWTLYPAELSVAENSLFEANSFEHPDGEPTLYYSPGVDVVTTTSKRWR